MHTIRFGGRNGRTFEVDKIIYVGPNGNDNNDGLTPETAVKTVSRLKNLSDDNTAVCLLKGSWNMGSLAGANGSALFGSSFRCKLAFGYKHETVVSISNYGRDQDCFCVCYGFYTNFTVSMNGMGAYGAIFRSTPSGFSCYNVNFIGNHNCIYDSYPACDVGNCCFNFNDNSQYYTNDNTHGVNNVYGTSSRSASNSRVNKYCKQVAPGSITDFYNPPSTFKNAGDPTILNPDGTRSDVGLLGGPYSWLLDVAIDPIDNASLVHDTLSIKTNRGGAGRLYNFFCLISFIIYITLFIYKKKGVV